MSTASKLYIDLLQQSIDICRTYTYSRLPFISGVLLPVRRLVGQSFEMKLTIQLSIGMLEIISCFRVLYLVQLLGITSNTRYYFERQAK